MLLKIINNNLKVITLPKDLKISSPLNSERIKMKTNYDGKTLDAVILLSSPVDKQCLRRARAALNTKTALCLITGGKTKESKEDFEAYLAYKILRASGILPSRMHAETRSTDSIENILNILKKVPEAKVVGIVSYPLHLDRVENIIRHYKSLGEIKEDLQIVRVETETDLCEKIYEIPARILISYLLKKPNSLFLRNAPKKLLSIFKRIFKCKYV